MEPKAETTFFKTAFQRKIPFVKRYRALGYLTKDHFQIFQLLLYFVIWVSDDVNMHVNACTHCSKPSRHTHVHSWKVTLWYCATVSGMTWTDPVLIIITWYLLSTLEEEIIVGLTITSHSHNPKILAYLIWFSFKNVMKVKWGHNFHIYDDNQMFHKIRNDLFLVNYWQHL